MCRDYDHWYPLVRRAGVEQMRRLNEQLSIAVADFLRLLERGLFDVPAEAMAAAARAALAPSTLSGNT